MHLSGLQQQKSTGGSSPVSSEQETEATVGTGSPKLDSRRLEKHTHIWCIAMIWSELGVNSMNPWIHLSSCQQFRLVGVWWPLNTNWAVLPQPTWAGHVHHFMATVCPYSNSYYLGTKHRISGFFCFKIKQMVPFRGIANTLKTRTMANRKKMRPWRCFSSNENFQFSWLRMNSQSPWGWKNYLVHLRFGQFSPNMPRLILKENKIKSITLCVGEHFSLERCNKR